jgi:GNAT superfamily N-acetyltransferase
VVGSSGALQRRAQHEGAGPRPRTSGRWLDDLDWQRHGARAARALADIWLRSVRVTHAFLTVADISFLQPRVRDYLASGASELYVVCTDAGAAAGFMGLNGNEIESLFLAPEHLRRGLGSRLIAEARSLRPGAVSRP